jgi:hypothetical protein
MQLPGGVRRTRTRQKSRNSFARCRAVVRPVTVPVATSSAAYRSTVPLRL